MDPNDQKVTVAQIETCFDLKLPDFIKQHVHNLNLRYRILTCSERKLHLEANSIFLGKKSAPSGPKRKNAWVEGWQQNLDESIADGINHTTLLPHYYRQGKTVMRYMGEFILPEDDFFEAKFLTIIRKILAHYFLTEHKNIYEFGAGPCHNILYFAHEVQEKNFYITDWVEPTIKIAHSIEKQKSDLNLSNHNFSARLFDFFNPDTNFKLQDDSLVLTFGSMEQIGTNFTAVLDYFMSQKTQHFIHVEPFLELYDMNNEFDQLAYSYGKKRNYLDGYLSALKNLELEGLIKIEYQKRTIGRWYHDSHTIVKWKKVA